MISSYRVKLAVSIVVAIIGLFAAGKLLLRSHETGSRAALEKAITPVVRGVLDGGYDTRPTKETVESDIQHAVQRTDALIRTVRSDAIPSPRRADLSMAFGERLSAVIDPDYMRDLRARVARGQNVEVVEPDEETLDSFRIRRSSFELLLMDVSALEVRPIYEHGKYVATNAIGLGFGTGETKLGGKFAFPMANLDPVKDQLDIVEVRLPMEIPVPMGREGEKRSRAIVGFQFVWSEERGQWVPWVIKTYGNPNDGVFGFPF